MGQMINSSPNMVPGSVTTYVGGAAVAAAPQPGQQQVIQQQPQPQQQQQQQNPQQQGQQQQQQQPLTLINQQPMPPRRSQPWHERITTDMRKHLIQKIVQTIFPTHDLKIYTDPRLGNLVGYAVRTESDMYEQARDSEEYFHLLAERIYKIQKEFEDKQKSLSQQQQQRPGSQQSQQQQPRPVNNTSVEPNGMVIQQPQQHSNIITAAGNQTDLQIQLNQLNAYNSGNSIPLILQNRNFSSI